MNCQLPCIAASFDLNLYHIICPRTCEVLWGRMPCPTTSTIDLGSKCALLRIALLSIAELYSALPGPDYILLILAVKCALLCIAGRRFAVLC